MKLIEVQYLNEMLQFGVIENVPVLTYYTFHFIKL